MKRKSIEEQINEYRKKNKQTVESFEREGLVYTFGLHKGQLKPFSVNPDTLPYWEYKTEHNIEKLRS